MTASPFRFGARFNPVGEAHLFPYLSIFVLQCVLTLLYVVQRKKLELRLKGTRNGTGTGTTSLSRVDSAPDSRPTLSRRGSIQVRLPLSRAEPSRAESNRARPSRAEPSRTERRRAEPSGVEPSRAELSQAESGRAESRRAEPSRAEKAEPSRAEPSRARPPLLPLRTTARRIRIRKDRGITGIRDNNMYKRPQMESTLAKR